MRELKYHEDCPSYCTLSISCAQLLICLVELQCSMKALARRCHGILGLPSLQKNNLNKSFIFKLTTLVFCYRNRMDSNTINSALCLFFVKYSILSRSFRMFLLPEHLLNFFFLEDLVLKKKNLLCPPPPKKKILEAYIHWPSILSTLI